MSTTTSKSRPVDKHSLAHRVIHESSSNVNSLAAVVNSMFLFITFSFAWVDQMLATAGQIAMNDLGSEYSDRIAYALELVSDEFTRPAQAAAWSYYVERPPFNIPSFRHWHFHPVPFSNDRTPTQERFDTDDLAAGINGTRSLLGNFKNGGIGRPWPWAFALKVLMGMICDSFSALHNTVLFSQEFPDGDDSGRRFTVRNGGRDLTLFELWESGCGAFQDNLTFSASDWETIDKLASDLSREFPREDSYDPAKVMSSTHEFDKTSVYTVHTGEVIGAEYIEMCQRESRRRVALAGWAIADSLRGVKVVLADRKAHPSQPMRASEVMSWLVMLILAPVAACLIWKKHASTPEQ